MSETKFCGRCQEVLRLVQGDLSSYTDHKTHHDSSESFSQAVEQGCHICNWVQIAHTWSRRRWRRDLEPVHHTNYLWSIPYEPGRRVDYVEDVLELNIYVYPSIDYPNSVLRLRLLDSNITESRPCAIRTALHPMIKSDETLSLVRQWINECCSKHVECRQRTDHMTLPSRLVRVQTDGTSREVKANVCRADVLPVGTPYLTLSHCWGNVTFLTTTRANLLSFESSLPVENLSKTFQDALYVTGALGFQYIWIDSLCIIQDDPEDWEREARRMHDTYKGASCNISASGFYNGEAGFMPAQRCDRSVPVPVTVDLWSPPIGTSTTKNTTERTFYLIRDDPWTEMKNAPIFLRAWTLQEQLLATRTVHFNDDQVYWECKATVANEVWPCGWRNTPLERQFQTWTGYDSTWRFRLEGLPDGSISIYNSWFDVVEDYTRRYLTYAADLIPALAGITKEYDNHLGDRNEYGLWTGDIHRGILWQVHPDNYTISHESTLTVSLPTVPSWSWIGLGKPVYWSYPIRRASEHICNVEIFHCKDQTLLRLRGTLMRAPNTYKATRIVVSTGYMQTGLKQTHCWGWDDRVLFYFYPDQWPFPYYPRRAANIGPSVPGKTNVKKDHEARTWVESTFIMPILYFVEREDEEKCTHTVEAECLLLRAIPGEQRRVYRRVGTVIIYNRVVKDVDPDLLKTRFEAWQRSFRPDAVQEEDDHGNDTITVV